MQEYRERKVETLSKGNQQKVQLLATLLHAPKLLVWDEPFSGLDPVGVQLVRELLRAERQRGCTVLLSTHLMEQAEQLCDRVGLLARGRLVRMGPLDELRAQGSRGNGPARLEEIFLDALRG
jgi:ABC-2 type transport system ATP-binding protein